MPEASPAPACQLYLVIEIDDGAADRFAAIAAAAPVAAVLLVPSSEAALSTDRIRPLVKTAQALGVAAMIQDDVALAKAVGADGVHLSQGPDVVARARAVRGDLAPQMMVGASAGTSRHDAMELGELGIDYVAFEARAGTDPDEAREIRLDLASWWAEIFEVPCVAWDVSEADEAYEHAMSGVEFIATHLPSGFSGVDAAGRVQALVAAIASGSEAAAGA